ncbi:MAG TPA: ribonucleoside-diphosphate reductase subunit alpha [Candidatus Paceibacterota bacterium]|nr:ribonucleoside-diphosphate reductase subunit alpha [Candidatus Paceibacterota bacterium]
MELTITKRDGTREPFNADKINRSIERACAGLQDPISMVTQIATETRLTLYDGITTEEMDQATINAAVQNIKEDIEYDKVAVRLLLKTIYRKVVGDYEDNPEILRKKHRDGFSAWIKKGVDDKLLDPRMVEKFDLKELANALDISRDELFVYSGLDTMLHRYSIKDKENEPAETPQYFFMRVAMGLSFNEKDPTLWAKRFYKKMSQMNYIAGGSTNVGAGTTRPSLSNCFLIQMEDDIEHIAKTVADVIRISKATGGLGLSVTKLRATGSPLSSNNTPSSGPTPFAKIVDTSIRAIQRGGKKKGALCFYMENWHIDFPEYLDWKHNAGDDYLRMRTADTAAWISDEFMRRVENHELWYMFDPKETPDLVELYGKEFSKRYAEYIEMAEKGELRVFKKVPAEEQYRQMLSSLQSTGHPWLTWKDSTNLRALNNNTGTIHMSNLCTEICLPQDKDNIAVCNLASLNLATHVHNKAIDWENLEESVRFAVHQLDNLIDINVLPVPEATRSDQENRAIGLGVMGLSDMLEQIGLSYESEHAWNFADKIFEFVSYVAIDESANLAAERGAYKNFNGSGWSKGMVPMDTLATLEEGRGTELTVNKEKHYRGLNWDALREKVKKGMRNATLMATAPNANIGLVAGTTPGIDPRFAQVFSRNKISGKYLDINHNLVNDLKNMSLWEKMKERIIAEQGDIANIDEIPAHIREIYKTSFSTSPYAFIEVAARAQKWMDQSLSRNMYLETRDIGDMMDIYATAWKKGLKSTYYLHMKPRHTAEQSTVHVNKAEQMGKRGFAAVMQAAASAPAAETGQATAAQPATKPFAVAETVASFIGGPVVATTAEASAAAPIEATLAKAPARPFAEAKPAPQQPLIQAQPKPQTQAERPAPASAVASNAPRIMPPSDPQEQFLCDSCQ